MFLEGMREKLVERYLRISAKKPPPADRGYCWTPPNIRLKETFLAKTREYLTSVLSKRS